MADLILDWGLLGAYGTPIVDSATVDTGGVEVNVAFTSQEGESGQAFTVNNDEYVGPGETFNPNSALKLFGDNSDTGPSDTSNTVLTFSATDDLYTDNVQNVSFRINDIDSGSNEDEIGGSDFFDDIVSIRAFDADGNEVPVTITPGSEQSVTDNTITGLDDGLLTDAENSALIEIEGPVARIEVDYDNGGLGEQRVTLTDVHFSTVDVDPNEAPDAVDDEDTTDSDTAVVINALDNDSDPDGDPLTVTGNTDPSNGDVVDNGDGTFTYTPDPDFIGTDMFDYTITDGNGESDTATVVINVTDPNNAPVAEDDDATVPAGETTPITVLDNDSDPDGDPLTVTDASSPNGDVTINPDGTLDYTPDPDFTGPDTITYVVSDPSGATDTAEVAVTVEDPNEPPVATDDAESTPLNTPVVIDVLDNDSDPDGDPLSVTFNTDPANGEVVDNGDGTFTYTPDDGYTGTDTFEYDITDGISGGDTGLVTVTVTDPNQAPIAEDDTAETDEGTPVTIPVLFNDSDPDGDPFTITAIDAPNGDVVDNGDGTITYTPDPGFTGDDTISYTITDDGGLSDTAEVIVNVDDNDPPVAVDDVDSTDVDTPITINVLENDSDPDGDPLSVTFNTDPANGDVVDNGDGTFTYTPDTGFIGTDTFEYDISDGVSGGDTGLVTITVVDPDPNDPPVAVDDTATVPDDETSTITVLDNDSDPDGDPLTVTDATTPNGTVSINPDGTLEYTPDPGFLGDDTISYTIEDPEGATDTADVVVTVIDGNLPPEAEDDADTTPAGTPVTISVLDNDSDPEGDDLTITFNTEPTNGEVVDNGDGTFTYTPDDGFLGEDTFEYDVSDPSGGSDTATVTITVTPDQDGIVEGTPGDDLIDEDYVGDPDTPADMVDNDDAILPGTEGDDDSIDAGDGDDTVDAGDGDDTVDGGDGNDSVDGGSGDDVIDTSGPDGRIDVDVFPVDDATQPLDPLDGLDEDPITDNDLDTVNGGAGNDTISTGDDADSITGGQGNDVIDAGIDDDTVRGNLGDDYIVDPQGSDLIDGGGGDDTIIAGTDTFSDYEGDDPNLPILGFTSDPNPNDGRDSVIGGLGNDSIMTGDDADTISGGGDNDTIDAGIDDDSVNGGLGDDSIIGSHGSDTLDGGGGDDFIDGSNVPALELTDDVDTVPENDRDSIIGGGGDDTLLGGDDDDTLLGGSGDDVIDGGIDEDSIVGGSGDDTITGGQGADTIDGGDGRDNIIGADGGDEVDGGSGPAGTRDDGLPEDYDTLDLTGSAPVGGSLNVIYTSDDREDGYVEFFGPDRTEDSTPTSTMTFEDIENVVPCFTPGTVIATPSGERLVEELREGDRIITRDNGIQEIRWTGAKVMNSMDLTRAPHMRPILIQAGSLGNGMPEHDILVSPNHRVLVGNDKTALYFEESEVLVAAKHLTGMNGVDEVGTLGTTYIHFMFDNHEVVLSNGVWTESFQPGDYTLDGIGNAQRTEIFELFPELETAEGIKDYASARRSLKKHEAKLLIK